MYHHVARALPGRLLFADAHEGHALWSRLCDALPGLVALCLMPNHVHLLHPKDVKDELGRTLSGYTRWRNARRGEGGQLCRRSPDPEWVEGATKIRRQIRYIHLNPCRARLVDDPLAWPFSTHLDAIGLALPARRRRAADPLRFHFHVSADPTVDVSGSPFPVAPAGLLSLEQVVRGVSVATRMPAVAVLESGSARRLLIASARGLTSATAKDVAATAGVTRRTVMRIRPDANAIVAALGCDERLIGWESAVRAGRRSWAS